MYASVLIKEICHNSPASTAKNTILAEVLSTMAKSHIDYVVIAEEKCPIGIFTERDALRTFTKSFDPEATPISSLMNPAFIVSQQLEVSDAFTICTENNIHHLIVVDNNEHLHGVVTYTDILKSIIKKQADTIATIKNQSQGNTKNLSNTQKIKEAFSIFENTIQGIIITDEHANILSVNQAFTKITGYEEHEVIGKNPKILNSGRQDKDFFTRLWQSLGAKGYWQGELWNRRKDGEIYAEWLAINVVLDNFNQVKNYIAVFADITAAKIAHDEFEFLAHHDYLTKLPNRLLFNERLNRSLTHTKRTHDTIAVLMIDLDGFKLINDQYGHMTGDEVLAITAERLVANTRSQDTVARLGGDEFAIILESMSENSDATEIAHKLIKALSEPIRLEKISDCSISLTASIGIAISSTIGNNPEILINSADNALYKAKDAGKNTVICT